MRVLEPNRLEHVLESFSKATGLSYCHRIDELKRSGQVLEPQDLHSHWRYSKSGSDTSSVRENDDILNDNHVNFEVHDTKITEAGDIRAQDDLYEYILSVERPTMIKWKARPKESLGKKRQITFENSTQR